MALRLKASLVFLFGCVAVVLSSCQWLKPYSPDACKNPVLDPTPYIFYFDKGLPSSITSALEKRSQLFKLNDKPPSGLIGLYQRIKKDREVFQKYLESQGYLDAKIKFKLDQVEKPKEFLFVPQKSVEMIHRVRFVITLNDRYKVHRLGVDFKNNAPDILPDDVWKSTNLKAFMPLDGESLVKGEEYVREFYAEHGYPFVKVRLKRAYIHRQKKTVDIVYEVDGGSKHTFGPMAIPDSKTLDASFIKQRVAWKEGSVYNESLVDRTRKRLVESNVFSGVNIKADPKAREEKPENITPIPMLLTIKEAPPRQIGAGGRFNSSQGASIRFFWRHFNVNKGGESFLTNIHYGKSKKAFDARYVIPDFFRPSQELVQALTFMKETTKAYRGKTFSYEIHIKPPLAGGIDGITGPTVERSSLIKNSKKTNNYLFGWDFGVTVDKTNDFLNPTRGFRFSPTWTPYTGKLNERERKMSVGIINASFYVPFGDIEKPFVLGQWVRMGRIFIKEFSNIPVNKRFYAGGEASVRGYGYQMLGPLQSDGQPEGGRNLLEGGLEARIPINGPLGAVAFMEAGNVNDTPSFTFDKKDTLYGWGVGVRYLSPVGPIRIDVAFPLKRRRDALKRTYRDAPFQLYFSIGQAF